MIDPLVRKALRILAEDEVDMDYQTGRADIELEGDIYQIDFNLEFPGAFSRDFLTSNGTRLYDLQRKAINAGDEETAELWRYVRVRLNDLIKPYEEEYYKKEREERRFKKSKDQEANEQERKTNSLDSYANERGYVVSGWLRKYGEEFDNMDNRHILSKLPRELESVFKGGNYNYRLMSDQRDFVGILPTPQSLLGSAYRGVYVFRSRSPMAVKEYGIREGDSYLDYIRKITQEEGNNLLDIRNIVMRLDLGMFFRRDHRLITVTQWLPNQERFPSYDLLKQNAAAVIENRISNLCTAIIESLDNWNTVRLVARDGSLYIPSSVMDAENREWFGNEGAILIHHYPAGDVDTIPWPTPAEWVDRLRASLYDAREQGMLPYKCNVVELPDGERFAIESVDDGESIDDESHERWIESRNDARASDFYDY